MAINKAENWIQWQRAMSRMEKSEANEMSWAGGSRWRAMEKEHEAVEMVKKLTLRMQCNSKSANSASSFIEQHKSAQKSPMLMHCSTSEKFFVFKILRWRVQTIYLDLKYPKKCEQTETMGWACESMYTEERYRESGDGSERKSEGKWRKTRPSRAHTHTHTAVVWIMHSVGEAVYLGHKQIIQLPHWSVG